MRDAIRLAWHTIQPFRNAGGKGLALVAALLLVACSPQRPATPALWEVSGPGGERGWVFGTVHALPLGVAWQSPAIQERLASADRLVLELGDSDGGAAQRAFLRLARTPGQPPLAERVPPELRDELAALLTRAHLDPAVFTSLEDWAAAMTLSTAAAAQEGFDPANGVESALRRQGAGRPIEGLETAAGQLGLFDGLSPPAQAALLDAAVAESADPAQGERLLAAWANGDMTALARETHGGMLAEPALREALLVARSRRWAERVDALLRAGARPFVAVGAAHVAGADGLPALLQARGWEVRRVQ